MANLRTVVWTCVALGLGGATAALRCAAADDQDSADAILRRAEKVLSQLDGDVPLTGLIGPVEVRRDQWGIAHIDAQNQQDLFFAQGFVAAQDRLFQLDLWRRVGQGETAELLGPEAIEADRFARLILYRGDLDAEWRSYSPDAREIATAFTNGINAYLDHAGERLPIEFQVLGYVPRRWKPEDVLGRMSGMIMSGNWQREIARARLIAGLGIEQARRLAPTDPPRDFSLDPSLDPTTIIPEISKGYELAARWPSFKPATSESNNWVVDGQWSASGKPLLAGDPHRALALPSLRYLVHLRAPGWNVIGSGEPALPGVAIGHNERVAWAFTIVGTDQADLYVERTDPADSGRYRAGDGWEPMRIVRESIRVKGRDQPEELELRFTRHGPVIYQDEKRNLAFALKWAGMEPGGAAYLGSLAVDRAGNRAEFLRALEAWKVPCLNFVYADVDGDIGWIAAALTPVREGWNGLLPVPGALGSYKWRGFLPVRDYPQRFRPAEHWVGTANHKILPPDYPHEIAYDWEPSFRYDRIRERIEQHRASGQAFTIEDFQSIQQDSRSHAARALVALLKKVTFPAELAADVQLLTAWDGNLVRESPAALLYSAWLQQLEKSYYARLTAHQKLDAGSARNLPLMMGQLSQPESWWFGSEPVKARDTLVIESLKSAVAATRQRAGDDRNAWRWGMTHTATFRHPLSSRGPAWSAALDRGPVARPGDSTTPNNTRYNEKLEQVHGASYRHVFDLADWDRAVATNVPGQSGQPGSPHYDDLLPLWAEGKYFPLAFSPAKIEQVTRHRLTLKPKERP